jgi:RNA polymerase sigma-70 factor (ECF subfamily)
MIFKKKASKQKFKTLTYPHMKLLYNVALKYTGNVFDAEDIVQETYLMAFHKFHQLKDQSRCKPWLLRILRNNFLKNCQKNKSRQRLEEGEYIYFLKQHIRQKDAEEELVNQSGTRLLKTAIDKLPVKYREVLLLYYMDDMLYKDIAKTLDIPIGTVMSRLTRAREGLKTGLLKKIKGSQENILDINFNQRSPKQNGL